MFCDADTDSQSYVSWSRYERCYAFYYGLRERGERGGELFLRSSQLKQTQPLQSFFLDQWAFMPTNACWGSVTLHDTDHHTGHGAAHHHSPPPPPPQSVWCGMSCGVPAAHCFEFSGGGLKSLARMLQEQQHVLTAAAVQAAVEEGGTEEEAAAAAAGRAQRQAARVGEDGIAAGQPQRPGPDSQSGPGAGPGLLPRRPRSLSSIEVAAQPQRRVSRFIDQLEDQIRLRLGVVLSQALSVVVAAFLAMVEAAAAAAAGTTATVSHPCACIGSPCLRHCVHGASIGGGGVVSVGVLAAHAGADGQLPGGVGEPAVHPRQGARHDRGPLVPSPRHQYPARNPETWLRFP
jgi:hypothetical protein